MAGPRLPGKFSKRDFQLDLDRLQATCPAGVSVPIRPGAVTHFPRFVAMPAPYGNAVPLPNTGAPLDFIRKRICSSAWRCCQRPARAARGYAKRGCRRAWFGPCRPAPGQPRPRYNGVAKNQLHLYLVCAIQNLELAQAFTEQKEQAKLPLAA
ncbi:MAG: hypothetical protein R3F37_20295 [Candidatus Competibacteraceae bacterium]